MIKNNKTTKNILIGLLLILLTFVTIMFIININSIRNKEEKNSMQTNEKVSYKVDKIVLYSSANGIIDNENVRADWELDIYQYTDIAIYIEKEQNENIKELYISDVNIYQKPELGVANLYYKNLNNFGRPEIVEENKVLDTLNFEIKSSDEEIDYNNPSFYNNCTSPIVLQYLNKDIKTGYIIKNINENLKFDGSLLKRSSILLDYISSRISFKINIVNNEKQNYVCNIDLEIPLKNEDSSIYDGSITKVISNVNNDFSFLLNKENP